MQPIPLDFDIQNLEHINNLVVVLGYIQGKAFNVEINESGVLPIAIQAYLEQLQEQHQLKISGLMDQATISLVNSLYEEKMNQEKLSSTTELSDSSYQVKGTIRNASWQGIAGAVVKVFEKLLRNKEVLLGDGTTTEDGDYEVNYAVPTDTKTAQPKETFHLVVKRYDLEGQEVQSLTFFNASAVVWANFTEGDQPYLGLSDFEEKVEKLNCFLDGMPIAEIEESDVHQDVTHLYKTTGIQGHHIMQLVLAHRIADYFKSYPALTADVLYSFIVQGLPANLPSYLLPDELSEWNEWIDALVEQTAIALVLTAKEIQDHALSIAIEQNKLLITTVNNISAVKTALQEARNAIALEKPLIAHKMALSEILEAVSLTIDEQTAIVEAFASQPEFSPAFIHSLEENGIVGEETAQALTKEYQLSVLGNYSSALIQQLKASFTTAQELEATSSKEDAAAPILKVRDFAKWSEQHWELFLGDEKKLAPQMKTVAESLAPDVATLAATRRTANHPLKQLDALESLVDAHPSLNLRENHLDSFIKNNHLELDEELVEELKMVQRVQRIAPNANVAAALLSHGVHSAHQAQQLGVQGLTPLLGASPTSATTAAQVASAANHMVALATGVYTTYGNVFNNVSPQAIINLTTDNPVMNDIVEGIPDLENLFGSNDYCACEHCRSVYSPAAYLTDILHWLGQRPALSPYANAKVALLARRPDLEYIDLNCKNSNTPLPYIDLVCEVLEQGISQNPDYSTRNTTWTAAELRAMPEYVQGAVYDKLAALDQPYASYNAFNLWQSEAHLYLENLGISYHQLIEILQKDVSEGFAKACAYFKIPTKEATAITVPLTDVSQLPWTPNVGIGRNVKTFLKDHQLSYQQLIELLQSRFINPTGSIVINRPVNSCGLVGQEIMGLGQQELDRIWRFLRLWKYTNWELWELDLVVVDLKVGKNDLNATNFITIYQFHQLQQQLDWSVEKCLALFGFINIHQRLSASNKKIESLYEQVYLNPLLNPALKNQFEINTVGTATSNINTADPELMAYIAMAVGADHDTVVTIIEQHAGAGFSHLRVLSAVYRQVSLAEYFRVTAAQLMEIVVLTQTNPFLNVNTSMAFLKEFINLQESGMTISAVTYLLKSDALQSYINNVQINTWQTALNDTLQVAYDALFVSNDSYNLVLDRQLSKISSFEDTAVRTQMIDLVLNQTWSGSAVDRDAFVDAGFAAWAPTDYISSLKDALALPIPSNLIDIQSAQNVRVKLVYNILHWHINRVLVVEFIAKTFSISEATAAYLLSWEHPNPTNSASLMRNLFGYSMSNVSFVPPTIFEAYYCFHKVALVVNQWDLSLHELEGLVTYKAVMNTLDLKQLPIHSSMSNLTYATWCNTWKFIQFSRQFGGGEQSRLFDILPLAVSGVSTDLALLQEVLSDWTGWDLEALEIAHTHFSLGVDGASYQTIETYQQLQEAIGLLTALPANHQDVLEWRKRNSAGFKTIHQQIKNALNAKLNKEAWLKAQQRIQDFIRIEKRDALIAYSLKYDADGNAVERSVEDLFNYYLIDPKMSACQLTSRIKQAISSTQLFVQRCRLSLESASVLVNNQSLAQWSEWQWMQNYRVWEANRKVFLYPENWIEPALRDDKSEFFKAFEDELLQAEITHDNVEKAFNNYLLKVHEVANMDMMGMCKSLEDGREVVHVLARTKEHPSTYYYRKQKDGIWTAWQKVDVDIKGDHAIPYVYNNRVHIFWLEILEKPQKQEKLPAVKDKSDGAGFAPEPAHYKEIQLSWTILKAEGWIPKKVSKRKLIHPWPRPHYSLHLRPRLKIQGGDLWIDIYVSTSREFNDTYFYNQFEETYELLTDTRFDETVKPYHSASFIFDGFVRQIKLYGIAGTYWFTKVVLKSIGTTKTVLDASGSLYIDEVRRTNGFPNIIVTNYGTYDFLDVNSRTALNQKINATKTHPGLIPFELQLFFILDFQGVVKVQLAFKLANSNWTLGSWITLQKFNDDLSGQTNYPRPEKTITVYSNETAAGRPNYQKEPQKKENSNSYEYIYNTFGEEGRSLIRMANEEQVSALEYPDTLHFEYNYLTGNRHGNYNNKKLILFKDATTRELLLEDTTSEFKVFYPMEETQNGRKRIQQALYQDELRSFYLNYEENKNDRSGTSKAYSYYPMYHPYTREFIRELNSGGVDHLLSRETQLDLTNGFIFTTTYRPTVNVSQYVTNEDVVDFSLKGTYATYNWEIFFHIPLLIATELSKNQRFEEAMRWFHFIFNPTATDSDAAQASPSSHFWMTKPFYKHQQAAYQAAQIQNLLHNTGNSEVIKAINIWKDNPFKPHLIASYRPVAFQKAVVMKYIDNLLAWGDQLFRRDTMESINQASLMYMFAYEILGKRPTEVTPLQTAEQNYQELSVAGLDSFANTDLEIILEGLVQNSTSSISMYTPDSLNVDYYKPKVPVLRTKYFCIPKNDKLLGYWDLVEDRLFKIRHCMNIDGVVRQLPLFAPPIDPALLVNAVANGVDLNSVISDLGSPRSNYKYRTLSRLAIQFCSEVKSLGQSLLAALQAKDSEGMALLQSANGLRLLDAMLALKELQIEEAKENIQSLELSKTSAIYRKDFYSNREFLIQEENLSLALGRSSIGFDIASTVLSNIAAGTSLIPNFELGGSGVMGTPYATASFGGIQISKALSATASAISGIAGIVQKEAGLASQKGGYKRRQEEWDLQIELATKESEQIEKQLAAATIRLALAEKDLENHKLQIENAKSEQEYLKTKYTNKELYSWMTSQLSTIYFQAYQLAFDMAKRAEKSMRYELALPNSSLPFIQFGYWDSLKKGLLSGDKLMLAINKMEAAYIEQHKRNYELTKQISLRQLAPNALLALKLTGTCELDIPEWWFDMDYPGHFMRRIKAVSLSIPCIVGPHTNVSCTLSMTKSTIRPSAIIENAYEHEDNYEVHYGMAESIAISNAQNDSGVFELNFNDERYLPFEGAGVVSRWTLTLSDIEQFDYQSITDVVLVLRYCAKEGGASLKKAALEHTKTILDRINTNNQPTILMSLKQEFGTAWHHFISPLGGAATHELNFELQPQHYPFFTKFGHNRAITACGLYVLSKDGTAINYDLDVLPIGGTVVNVTGTTGNKELVAISPNPNDGLGAWHLKLNHTASTNALNVEDIKDIILTIDYKIGFPS